MTYAVYLAGPITGRQEDFDWRDVAAALLARHGIGVISPLRSKRPEEIGRDGLDYGGAPAPLEMADQDAADVGEADAVLAHFPYVPERQAVGTFIEIGMAIEQGKPVHIVTAEPTIHEHLFVRNWCRRHASLEDAVADIACDAQAEVAMPSDPYLVPIHRWAATLGALRRERGTVYGDPAANHRGIGMMWTPLLQPHAEALSRMEPLPPHVVALMMATLKLNRMRHVHHPDNYDDAALYLAFAEVMQKEPKP